MATANRSKGRRRLEAVNQNRDSVTFRKTRIDRYDRVSMRTRFVSRRPPNGSLFRSVSCPHCVSDSLFRRVRFSNGKSNPVARFACTRVTGARAFHTHKLVARKQHTVGRRGRRGSGEIHEWKRLLYASKSRASSFRFIDRRAHTIHAFCICLFARNKKKNINIHIRVSPRISAESD